MTAEIKEYTYSPIVSNLREKVIKEAKESTQIDDWFLSQHLMEVERFANLLCDKYPDADRDVVGLGVWYHDIGRLRGQDEGHDVYGADEAKKVLGKEGFAPDKIERVYEVCRSHRCKDIKPESLEAKILATADAMSHFTHSFYFRLFQFYKDELAFEEIKDKVLQKLERDFNDKIAFDEGREEVRTQYEAMKLVLQD
jgi:putative nucleotidyltransferase with HDIG domain